MAEPPFRYLNSPQSRNAALDRRTFFKWLGGAAGAWLTAPYLSPQEAQVSQLLGVPLEPFVDPLPVLSIARPLRTEDGKPYFRFTLSEFVQKLHRDLAPSVVWGFNGITPGPTVVAERGQGLMVEWVNALPKKHRLAVDHNLAGAARDLPSTRAVVHLHGGHVSADNDGHPEQWTVPGESQRAYYPNQQPAATLWYHDHAMGIARLNSIMGLSGLYLLRDKQERDLNLPEGDYEITLLLQDRVIDANGQLAYPVSGIPDAPWVPEFFGSQVLVNGKVWPFLEVEPDLYRVRVLNASNARVYRLSLTPGQTFLQIGSDGGLLPKPVEMNELLLAPSERADLLIDFRGRSGHRIVLSNDAPSPFPSGGKIIPHIVMQFRVARSVTDKPRLTPVVTTRFPPLETIAESESVRTRKLTLDEIMGADGVQHRMLLNGKTFMDPVTEDPQIGTVEIWEFVNATIDAHPIHLHAVHFRLLSRRAFDVRRFARNGEVIYTRPEVIASGGESGWKDTILCPPGQVTRIIVRFDGYPGRYVWHCHTLEHEDNEMMRPLLLRER